MRHVLTLTLPPAYRRRGHERPGIALFQADDHADMSHPGVREALVEGRALSPSPFLADLVRSGRSAHPQGKVLTDAILGHWALLWLSTDELSQRCSPPRDTRDSAVRAAASNRGENSAWDRPVSQTPLWLVERAFDPNAGKTPMEPPPPPRTQPPPKPPPPSKGRGWGFTYEWVDGPALFPKERSEPEEPYEPYVPTEAYVDIVLSRVGRLHALYEEVKGRCHLGGSVLAGEGIPPGLSPYYLEILDGVGGVNVAGGELQLDLEREVLTWAP